MSVPPSSPAARAGRRVAARRRRTLLRVQAAIWMVIAIIAGVIGELAVSAICAFIAGAYTCGWLNA